MKTYLKNDENYDTNLHYDYEWVHLSVRSIINLWENKDSPLAHPQYENWYSVNLFGSCLDFCFRDFKLGTDVKRLLFFFLTMYVINQLLFFKCSFIYYTLGQIHHQ